MSNVSVIIPTWNRASTIVDAVQSALEQTHAPTEVLVCDDGSTDETEAIIAGLKDPRVIWLPGTATGTPAAPRNRGVVASRGEWLAFLDSDDRWLPEKLEKQLDAARKTNLLAVSTNAEIAVDGKETGQSLLQVDARRLTFERFVRLNEAICSSVLLHRSVIHGPVFPEGKDLRAIEDYAAWLRVATLSDFAYLPECLTVYNDHSHNSIRVQDVTLAMQKRIVFKDFLHWSGTKNHRREKLKPYVRRIQREMLREKLSAVEKPLRILGGQAKRLLR